MTLTLLALVWLVSACSGPNTAEGVAERQRAIQTCILSGGHPRLGPDSTTIICE